MKHVVLCLLFYLFVLPAFSQRILSHYSLNDIDDMYNFIDTFTVNRGFHTLDLYNCKSKFYQKDSCIHYAQQRLDSTGRLIELIKGNDLDNKKIDYWVLYKKLSDSNYQTLVTYPPGSTMISDLLFVDTMIKGRYYHVSLYRKDKNGNIVIRSLYYINKYNELRIERYDLDNKLQQIFYPLGKNDRTIEWVDSMTSNRQKTVSYHATLPGYEYTSGNVFSKDGRLLETFYMNTSPNNQEQSESKTLFVYDKAARPIIKISLGKNNLFVSEERFYYKNEMLVRYTLDENLMDIDVNEEKVYNDSGYLISVRSKPFYFQTETYWRYFYLQNGLKEKDELYKDGEYKSTRFYKFK